MAGILKVDQYQDFNGNNIMTSDGAGNITINASAMKMTPAFLAYASSNQTVGHQSWTKVTLGTELFDTDSAFASNKFTVPTGEGGKYWFNGCVNAYAGANNLQRILMRLYKNGNGFAYLSSNDWNNQAYRDQETATGSTIIDLSAGDYIELYIWFSHASSGNTTIVGSSATEFITKLSGYKIIGA